MATEKRLVDANVVSAKQFTAGLSDVSGNYYGHADVVFVSDIENAPIVDAVEVVRCKDCKHWNAHTIDGTQTLGICTEGWIRNVMPHDGFCSRGEREINDRLYRA